MQVLIGMKEKTSKNHSATIYFTRIKEVLGEHVNQAGSLVESERLRFDFSHFGPMTQDEIDQVERRVNEEIWRGISVNIQEMPINEAKQMGAMALFGENTEILCALLIWHRSQLSYVVVYMLIILQKLDFSRL